MKGNFDYINNLHDMFDNLKFWGKYSLQECYFMTPKRRQRAMDNINKNLEILYPSSKNK